MWTYFSAIFNKLKKSYILFTIFCTFRNFRSTWTRLSHSPVIWNKTLQKESSKNIKICGCYAWKSEPTFHWFYCNKRHLKILILMMTDNTNHKYWDLMKFDNFKILIKTVSLHVFEQINPLAPSTWDVDSICEIKMMKCFAGGGTIRRERSRISAQSVVGL